MKYDYLISGKSKENLRMELPSLFSNYIMDLIQEQRPQYLNDMPFLRGKIAKTVILEDMCFQIFQMPKHHIQESALMLGK